MDLWRVARIARKLRLIAACDLTHFDKLRYVMHAAGSGDGDVIYRLRDGQSVLLRGGTTDAKVFDEIFLDQAYAPCIRAMPDDHRAVTLIDLGANIGLSALFLAGELNVSQIVAVEPDPDNFRLLCENLRRSVLATRTVAVQAFAGAEPAFAELHDSGNGAWGMRMGARSDAGTPVLPLADIAAETRAPRVLKCDIEGGERELFLHLRDWEHLVDYIFLELHTEFLPTEELSACLESSGFEWTTHGTPPRGACIALLMLERGAPRNRR